MTSASDYRVVLVDHHALFVDSLQLTLSIRGYDVGAIPVSKGGRSPAALLSAISRMSPRLVLLDLDLGPSVDGMSLITPLARSRVDVVVVTASNDRGRWGEAVHRGARKVLHKSWPLQQTLAVVRRLQQGLSVQSVTERQELVHTWHEMRATRAEHRSRMEQLTRREREVMAALTLGQTVREIASDSMVSEATVRTQVKSILAKLQVTSQLAAVSLARDADRDADREPTATSCGADASAN